MKIIEVKGDITFFEDEKRKQFQQLGEDGEIIKVKNGSIAYIEIKQVNGCKIKYNTNGVYGYSIWANNINLEDRIWTLEEAERIAIYG